MLKDLDNKVVCPALSRYRCPICNNTGFDAHTVKHCPYNPEKLQKQRDLEEIWRNYRRESDPLLASETGFLAWKNFQPNDNFYINIINLLKVQNYLSK